MKALLPTSCLLFCFLSTIQGQIRGSNVIGADFNSIQTSVPFLIITPDGRSSGTGDAGVASTPDVNSQHWNPAKFAFVEGKGGLAVTYSPWIRHLIPDVVQLYFSAYYKTSDRSAFSSSFRYISLGKIYYFGAGMPSTYYSPREFALDAGYSRKFTDHFSGGLVLRYIQSDISRDLLSTGGSDNIHGRTLAADFGIYYENDIQLKGKEAQWALGLNISNMGAPVSYTKDDEGLPIPTNLRMGGRFTYSINQHNSITVLADLNKLLVPTPAEYEEDSVSGGMSLVRGREANSTIHGMIQSFYDAPGIRLADGSYNVAREELKEIAYSAGIEYWHKNRYAFRTGYFHEDPGKGNRQYFTFGLGVRFGSLSWDFSYLLPREGANSPLYNTFRLAFAAELGK